MSENLREALGVFFNEDLPDDLYSLGYAIIITIFVGIPYLIVGTYVVMPEVRVIWFLIGIAALKVYSLVIAKRRVKLGLVASGALVLSERDRIFHGIHRVPLEIVQKWLSIVLATLSCVGAVGYLMYFFPAYTDPWTNGLAMLAAVSLVAFLLRSQPGPELWRRFEGGTILATIAVLIATAFYHTGVHHHPQFAIGGFWWARFIPFLLVLGFAVLNLKLDFFGQGLKGGEKKAAKKKSEYLWFVWALGATIGLIGWWFLQGRVTLDGIVQWYIIAQVVLALMFARGSIGWAGLAPIAVAIVFFSGAGIIRDAQARPTLASHGVTGVSGSFWANTPRR